MSKKKLPEERIGNIAPLGLRIPADLKERIAAAADAAGRSMNAEILDRLERSLSEDDVILNLDGQPKSAEAKRELMDILQDMVSKSIDNNIPLSIAFDRYPFKKPDV